MSFEELKAQVDELGVKIAGFENEVNRVKIISQRTSRDSKAYGALNQGELERLREEMDAGFQGVHERMDALNTAIEQNSTTLNLILGLMRKGVRDVQQEGTEKDGE